ncbi:MAG TPA: chromosome segregation protein SMC [Gemmatimonadaceae bacterium]|nr:chromosome segregation protein SMC [Gemmatimonadaceae bacterium]
MRLTKLELQGFKSFADQTELVFEPGVTAIVGPNGCGKSNVSDAVRWVLGEQRARALRGAKMEEVIFQGSSARRAVNIAEVSLFFENDDGTLPVPFKEVVITRRLSRSGESDYLLNRAPCRLRDIHDMVRGTGLGADSGVVIEARMIDALLSDRPDDRRELFEEAAGVGLYRDRRRSTERRLEETTVDLSRLDDLISEVQSQVRSLARQRKRAERHAELMERRFALELTLAAREMEAWREELARLEERVAELRPAQPEAEDRVRDAERAREDAHGARTAAEAHRAELARLVAQQQQDALRLEGELAVANERQRNAVARRQRAEEERRHGELSGSQLMRDRDQAEAERIRLAAELEGATEALAGSTRAEEEARTAVGDARTAFESTERRVRELRDSAGRAALDREGALRELEELKQRSDSLGTEREQMSDQVELARRERALAQQAVEEARDVAASSDQRLAAARENADAARASETAARQELFRAEETLTSLQGKVNALQALERERVGLAPAAARLLRERERFSSGAVLGPISDFISAGSSSALAVEKFLGATVHAIVVRDRAAAEEIRAWHAASNPGPLLLLPLDARHSDGGGALADDVEATEPARAWVRTLLGRVEAVEGGAAFVDARGAVWLPGTVAGPGPLRRRAELAELRLSLGASAAARDAASAEADAARVALESAESDVLAASEARNVAHQENRRAEEHHGEIVRRVQRAERELEQLDASIQRLHSRREELRERLARIDEEVAGLATALRDQERDIGTARERLDAADHSQETARNARTSRQVERAQIEARLQMAIDRERRLTEEVSNASARLQALMAELSDIEEADTALAANMAVWQLELESRRAALEDGERRLESAERAVLEADDRFAAAEHTLDAVRHAATELAEELHHAELRLTELSGRRTAIRERLEAEWRRPLDEMLETVVPLDLDDETLRADVGKLREDLESLGAVNPLAIEEHEEETKRLDFLTTQRNDLAAAKQSLMQAIREIDTTARELFLETFVQVRENFRQIFMTLFGGGECDLRLENPELPLDCDIEIHASPRGKRTQRIHLLSSGERALVALSLLFGIFLTKPSPFCLLDEVDAPLDDQNVGRFVKMLNQFKDKTQFIVITHNPRTTTEAADAVYGVTMQEPGVSSFVSVRMRGAPVEEDEIPTAVQSELRADARAPRSFSDAEELAAPV